MATIPKDLVNISSYDVFRSQMLGNGVDVDGYYGFQCWDGCAVLWYKLGWTLYTGGLGYAVECWTVNRANNTHPPKIIAIYDKTQIKRGDVVVFKAWGLGTTEAGHIAYADEDYTNSSLMKFFGQNQGQGAGFAGKPFSVDNLYTADIIGAFRYIEWDGHQPTPTPVDTSKRKKKFPWIVAWNNWNNFR